MTQHQIETDDARAERSNITPTDWKAVARARLLGGLKDYFASGEADQGLRSSWGPLADIALGGFGGSPDPERGIVDHRFRFAGGETPITEARRSREALTRLTEHQQCVLFAAHGPVQWTKIIDAAFGRGMAFKVQRRLGDLIAVALLTEIVREGFEREAARQAEPIEPGALVELRGEAQRVDAYWTGRKDKPPRRPAWGTSGGWLVALCLDKTEAAKKKAARLKTEAGRMLAAAETAYLDARGLGTSRRASAGDRRRAHVAEVMA